MNIFYEESGQFKVATIVQKSQSTYQVDTQHGKRTKVKANHVFVEFSEAMETFFAAAQKEAAEMDTQLLWEVCGEEEFSAESIATEYFGTPPTAVQLAATLMALYAAPIYFYKKSKGVFKAASEEVLKQALLAVERKKQQDEQMAQWSQALQGGQLPEEIAADLKTILHAPDKQSLTYKAFMHAAATLKMSVYELGKHVGGITSIPQYMLEHFEMKHFPKGIQFPDLSSPALPDLPIAEGVKAFSVDDEGTTEIDDALSVQTLPNGHTKLGIHIAAPSLGIEANSVLEQIIFERLSTVYYPSGKITMLPESYISLFSLDEGQHRPAFSIYFEVDVSGEVLHSESRLERVYIERNLRIPAIEPYFNSEVGVGDPLSPQFPFHAEMITMHRVAQQRQKLRDRSEEGLPKRYDYSIVLEENGRVQIARRERGSPIDTMVSEMMILANSTWAKMLDEQQISGVFRVQPSGRVRMSTRSEPHIGMNLQHYGWFTSPLRRSVDYINQKQLYSLLSNGEIMPRFSAKDSMLFATLESFEVAHHAYREFQDSMESYWSLVYIEQEALKELYATVIKDDLVRIEGLPLLARVMGMPPEIEPKSRILLSIMDVDSEKQFISLKYLNRASVL